MSNISMLLNTFRPEVVKGYDASLPSSLVIVFYDDSSLELDEDGSWVYEKSPTDQRSDDDDPPLQGDADSWKQLLPARLFRARGE